MSQRWSNGLSFIVSVRFQTLVFAGAIALILTSCSDVHPDPLAGTMLATDVDSAIVQAAAIDFLENGGCNEGSGKYGIVVVDETLAPISCFSGFD
jgi:hypothetical protein